jgi:hypothetical protein
MQSGRAEARMLVGGPHRARKSHATGTFTKTETIGRVKIQPRTVQKLSQIRGITDIWAQMERLSHVSTHEMTHMWTLHDYL